mmetsp:Transcript_11584/g.27721  ORF Transcript_11584/g.27721 Transcript_11584/m.27721 type:complete len:583 (+) Transcript_11584:157-1905(+)
MESRPPSSSEMNTGATTGDDKGDDSGDWKLGFPWKLHKILQDAEDEGFDDIIRWTPNGKAFVVVDKDRFSEEIMPRYFRSNKFKTFQRSSNMWGFQTAVRHYPYQGLERGDCHHELFLKGRLDLCHGMARIKSLREEAEIQRRNMERAKKEQANGGMNTKRHGVDMSSSVPPSHSFGMPSSTTGVSTDQTNAVQALTAALLNNPAALQQNPQQAATTGVNPVVTLLPRLLQQQQQQQQEHQVQQAMAMNVGARNNSGGNQQGVPSFASLLTILQAQQQSSAMQQQWKTPPQQAEPPKNDIFLQQVLQSLQGRGDASKGLGNLAAMLQLLLSVQQNQNSATANAQQQQLIQALQAQLNLPSTNGGGGAATPQSLMQYISNGQLQAGPAIGFQGMQQAQETPIQASIVSGDPGSRLDLLRQALGGQSHSQTKPAPSSPTSGCPDLNMISKVLQAQAMINASKGGSGNASIEDIAQFLSTQQVQGSSAPKGEGKEVSDVSDLSSDDSCNPDALAQALDGKTDGADGKNSASSSLAVKAISTGSDTNSSSQNTSLDNINNLEAARGLQRLLKSEQAKALLSNLRNR